MTVISKPPCRAARYYAERVIPVGPLTWNAEPTLVAGSGTARFGDHSIHLKELQSWLRPSDRAFMDPTIPTIATIYESGAQTWTLDATLCGNTGRRRDC